MKKNTEFVIALAAVGAIYFVLLPSVLFTLIPTPLSQMISTSYSAVYGSEYVGTWRLIYLLYGAILLTISFCLHKLVFRRKLKELGLASNNHIKDIFIGIVAFGIDFGGSQSLIFVVLFFVYFLAPNLFPILTRFEAAGWMSAFSTEGPLDSIALLAITWVLVAPAEEVFFRGFLQGASTRFKGPMFGIILSSILFGLVQAFTAGLKLWYVVLSALLMGIVHGYIFYKRESILPGIVAHAFYLSLWLLL